jgi:hypothetical protein
MRHLRAVDFRKRLHQRHALPPQPFRPNRIARRIEAERRKLAIEIRNSINECVANCAPLGVLGLFRDALQDVRAAAIAPSTTRDRLRPVSRAISECV